MPSLLSSEQLIELYKSQYNTIWRNRKVNTGEIHELVKRYARHIGREHEIPSNQTPTLNCIDFGIGMACDSIYLSKRAHSILGLDNSQIAVDKVNAFSQASGLNIVAHLQDITTYNPQLMFYDAVLSLSTLHFLHPDQIPQVLMKISDTTKNNGFALIRTYTSKNMQPFPGLVEKGYLRDRFKDWNIISYEEATTPLEKHEGSDWHTHDYAQILAQKR